MWSKGIFARPEGESKSRSVDHICVEGCDRDAISTYAFPVVELEDTTRVAVHIRVRSHLAVSRDNNLQSRWGARDLLSNASSAWLVRAESGWCFS